MRKKFLFFSLLLIHLLILVKLQFTAWPEMVSYPYLLNHGFTLYKDFIHPYPSLLTFLLAQVFKIFGYQLIVLKIFGWVSILISDLFIFFILKKMLQNTNKTLMGIGVYIILQPILQGNMVWPDLFIVPFILLTFLFLLKEKYFFSGIVIGLAILTKQTGVLFLGISGLWILIYKRNLQTVLNFVFGASIVVLPFLIILIKQNSLIDFINWAIIYPSQFWTKFPGYVQLLPSKRDIINLIVLFVPIPVLLAKSFGHIKKQKEFYLLLGFLATGILGIYPRFSFFHFQTALVFLVIVYFYLLKNFGNKFLYFMFIVPVLILLINIKGLQLGESRFWTNQDIEFGQIIKNETPGGQSIYLLGVPSQMYVFADRLPNKPWVDNYGWYLEIPNTQLNVVTSFLKNPPSKIFWATPNYGNWYDIGTYQPKMVTDYIIKNYTKTKEIQKGIWEWKRN